MKKLFALMVPALFVLIGCSQNHNPVAPATSDLRDPAAVNTYVTPKILFAETQYLGQTTFKTMDLDGKNLRNLTVTYQKIQSLDANRASNFIFYTTSAGIFKVRKDVANSAAVQVLSFPGPKDLRISPDNTRIAFEGAGGIYLCTLAGANQHKIPNTGANASHPIWTPAGQLIFTRQFRQADDSGYLLYMTAVYRINPDGSNKIKLYQFQRATGYPNFAALDCNPQLIMIVLTGSIYTMNLDGTNFRLWNLADMRALDVRLLDDQTVIYNMGQWPDLMCAATLGGVVKLYKTVPNRFPMLIYD